MFLQILSYAFGSMALVSLHIFPKLQSILSLFHDYFKVMIFLQALSFTHRWVLSVPLLGMGVWPIFSSTKHHLSSRVLVSWQIGCIILSIFTFIPVVGKDVFIELV